MKKAKTGQAPRSSSLFLIELMIAILFFALASAACLQVFAKAHTISDQAESLSRASADCSSVAEMLQASDDLKGFEELVKAEFSAVDTEGSTADGGNRIINISYKDGSSLRLSNSIDGHMLICRMRFFTGADSKPLYKLTVHHNLQEVSQ